MQISSVEWNNNVQSCFFVIFYIMILLATALPSIFLVLGQTLWWIIDCEFLSAATYIYTVETLKLFQDAASKNSSFKL